MHSKPSPNRSNQSLVDVDAITVQKWLDDDQAILVDVREADEFQDEHIPGAVPFPLSRFDATALPRNECFPDFPKTDTLPLGSTTFGK